MLPELLSGLDLSLDIKFLVCETLEIVSDAKEFGCVFSFDEELDFFEANGGDDGVVEEFASCFGSVKS